MTQAVPLPKPCLLYTIQRVAQELFRVTAELRGERTTCRLVIVVRHRMVRVPVELLDADRILLLLSLVSAYYLLSHVYAL